MNPVAEKIRTARLEAQISEKQLAKQCGLAENYIKQIESGKKVVNEQTAQKILNVLKVDTDILQQGANIMRSEPETVGMPAKFEEKKETAKPVILEPNDQWSDALAHIIKQVPVIEMATGKTIATKYVPVLGKKVEGCPWDKIRYYRVSDDQLAHLRIRKNDVVTVCETKEITNGKLTVVEVDGQRLIRQAWKENKSTVVLSEGNDNKNPIRYTAERVRVLGVCMKLEFYI